MQEIIVQLISICGVLFGLITFLMELKKGEKKQKEQLHTSIAIIIVCSALFLKLTFF